MGNLPTRQKLLVRRIPRSGVLGNCHIEVADSRQVSFEFCQFVIVGGKQRTGIESRVVMQELNCCPSNGHAVVRAGATPDLVKDDEAVGRGMGKDSDGDRCSFPGCSWP